MHRDNICMYMRMFVVMSVVVTVWGSVGMFVVRKCWCGCGECGA